MQRMAKLAVGVWIAVIASITLFTLFWRCGHLRPHPLWGVLSLVAIFTPMTWLAVSALRRIVCGPCRLRAIGWLLVGATPLVWAGAYVTELAIQAHTRTRQRAIDVPLRVTFVWVSSMLEIEARRCCPRWTHGRHNVLMDDGRTPSPEKLVAEMDRHIQALCDQLGQPVPEMEFPWIRGYPFGFRAFALPPWALCGADEYPDELTYVDRHEVAHTVIYVLSGPDHEPGILLGEGWAQSQSRARNELVQNLAEKRREGRTYSLRNLASPDAYFIRGPAYWEGGPLVHYLIEHYGPETFFRLYTGVRPDSFHDDCQAILGDTWETVEENFWEWIEAEDALLAEADVEPPDAGAEVHVELAQSVDTADWQALVEGYREANKDSRPLPANTAFVLEGELTEAATEGPGSNRPPKFEFRAVFEGEQFWIYDNNYHSGDDWFLMVTHERCADLVGDDSGSLDGRVRPGWAPYSARDDASDLLAFYRGEANLGYFLPLRGTPRVEATYHIERVVRPTDGKTGRWNVWFTKRRAESDKELHYQLELDPEQRWWVTRIVREIPGQWRSEADAEYDYVGDAFLPVTLHHRSGHVRWRVRPMSEVERRQLKQRVEAAAQRRPRVHYHGLRRFLVVIVIACPLAGAALLGITRRRDPLFSP